MLKKIFIQEFYLQKHLAAPLLKEREEYLKLYFFENANRSYLQRIAEETLRIVELLCLKDDEKNFITLTQIEVAAEKYGKLRASHPRKQKYSISGKRRFIARAKSWLKYCNRLELLKEDSVPIFNELFEKVHTRKIMSTAPLLKERVEYLEYWKKQGAKRSTLKIYAEYELHIIKYLSLEVSRSISMQEIYAAAKLWSKDERAYGRFTNYSKCAERRFIIYSKKWLTYMNCLKTETGIYPFYEESRNYLNYLLYVKGYSSVTIKTRENVLGIFFNKLILQNPQCNKLLKIKLIYIDNTIKRLREENKWARSTISSNLSILRNFFEYAEHQEWCKKGLSTYIKTPRIYCGEDFPYAPKWDDMKRAVQYYESDTPSDIRNYAIMQLLVVYGIRRSEVANMKIKDIDWKKEQLYLNRAKGGKPQIFPLVKSVGDAILHYLKRSRKNESLSEYLFLCANAPYRKISPSAVSALVRQSLISLGIDLKHYGPHSLRHGCATHLINSGFTMKEISDHLGHQHLDTTCIYAKVNLLNLRKVADLNWEGIL